MTRGAPGGKIGRLPTPTRVLVVDDERDVRDLVARVLRAVGYLVDEASDGQEALDHLQGERPDLVLLDLMMPGLDGWAVLDWLETAPQPPPVVVLTVRDDREAFTRATAKGAVGFLSKPFRFGDVLSACRRVLESRSHPATAPAEERRHESRKLLMANVTVYSLERRPMAIGQLMELSRGGARIELDIALPTLSRVYLSFQGRGLEMRLAGRVVWTRTAALTSVVHGLMFLDLLPEQHRLVSELLALPAPE